MKNNSSQIQLKELKQCKIQFNQSESLSCYYQFPNSDQNQQEIANQVFTKLQIFDQKIKDIGKYLISLKEKENSGEREFFLGKLIIPKENLNEKHRNIIQKIQQHNQNEGRLLVSSSSFSTEFPCDLQLNALNVDKLQINLLEQYQQYQLFKIQQQDLSHFKCQNDYLIFPIQISKYTEYYIPNNLNHLSIKQEHQQNKLFQQLNINPPIKQNNNFIISSDDEEEEIKQIQEDELNGDIVQKKLKTNPQIEDNHHIIQEQQQEQQQQQIQQEEQIINQPQLKLDEISQQACIEDISNIARQQKIDQKKKKNQQNNYNNNYENITASNKHFNLENDIQIQSFCQERSASLDNISNPINESNQVYKKGFITKDAQNNSKKQKNSNPQITIQQDDQQQPQNFNLFEIDPANQSKDLPKNLTNNYFSTNNNNFIQQNYYYGGDKLVLHNLQIKQQQNDFKEYSNNQFTNKENAELKDRQVPQQTVQKISENHSKQYSSSINTQNNTNGGIKQQHQIKQQQQQKQSNSLPVSQSKHYLQTQSQDSLFEKVQDQDDKSNIFIDLNIINFNLETLEQIIKPTSANKKINDFDMFAIFKKPKKEKKDNEQDLMGQQQINSEIQIYQNQLEFKKSNSKSAQDQDQ